MTLPKILSHPWKWRRTRGFGVHSPFAFRFITRVIGQRRAAYYAYTLIDGHCPKARRRGFNEIFAGMDFSIPVARLLFRLLCEFNPPLVVEIGSGQEVTNVVIAHAVPQAKHVRWTPGRQIALPDDDADGHRPTFVILNSLMPDDYQATCSFILSLLARSPGDRGCVLLVRNLHLMPAMKRLWEEVLRQAPKGMAFFDTDMGIFVSLPHLPRQDYSIII